MSEYLYGQKKTHRDIKSFMYKLARGLQSRLSTTFTNKKLPSPIVLGSNNGKSSSNRLRKISLVQLSSIYLLIVLLQLWHEQEEGKYDLYSQSTTRRDGKGGYRATMFVYGRIGIYCFGQFIVYV